MNRAEEKAYVLYIDDEENNLLSFKSCYRQFYHVHTAASASEGFMILEKYPIQVIVADQRMPGMTGVEFLKEVVRLYPQTIRVLLTGYSDIEAVINAINEGQIYRYIKKPWDEHYLKVTIDNASEIYRTRKLLEEKTKNLEKTRDELDRFAYSASHDLRSPLMTILGIMNLAKREEQYLHDEYFQMIEKMVKKLDDFTRNIVEHYKNDKVEQHVNPIDFNVLVYNIIEDVKLFRNGTAVDFMINIRQQEAFSTDEFRVQLILNNLILNAINYRDERKTKKTVEITVVVEKKKAVIDIKDNGLGIESEHLSRIFDMFYRASVKSQGSGLGLYIVKEAIQKINGTISVTSVVDEGTSFQIIIPSRK